MLTRTHKILLAMLAVQLALIAVMAGRSGHDAPLKERPLLAGFDAGTVTRLQIFTPKADQPIDLVKRGASWVMASHFDYPVDEARITELLTPVARMAAAAPITSQASRHAQLGVADADYQRKVVITAGGKDLTVWVGQPAGLRRNAVRLGADQRVYAVAGVTATAANNEARHWARPRYIDIPREQVAKVSIQRASGTLSIAKRAAPPPPAPPGSAPPPPAPDEWEVALDGAPVTLAAGETLNLGGIDAVIDAATAIELSAPADPKRDAAHPTATITVERAAGAATPATTTIDLIADGESYWVHERGAAHAVMVDKAQVSDLIDANRDKLVEKPTQPAATAGTMPGLPPG